MTRLRSFPVRLDRLVVWLGSLALVACASSEPPAASPAPAEPAAPASSTPAKASAAEQPTPATPTTTEQPSASPAAEPKHNDPDTDPDNKQRTVLYRSTADGLVVSVQGVEFRCTAEPVHLKNGGFGVHMKVTAEAKDDNMHTLMYPASGPLAVAGKIKRKKGGDPETFGDQRGNDEEQFVAPGTPLEIERDWPDDKGPFAWYGDEIELQVGLWGLADAGERRRPVQKLFLVKMMALPKAKPVVIPPRI